MEQHPEVIRQQMEETRESLSDKLEVLEQKVLGTVQDTTNTVTQTVESVADAVQSTVASVKEGVQEGVEKVKETFDLSLHVERHPWEMLVGSIAAGFAAGYLLTPPQACEPGPAVAQPYKPTEPAQNRPAQPSWLGDLSQQLEPVFSKVKGLAIGAAMDVIGKMVMDAAPPVWRQELPSLIDQVTTALGGKPMHDSHFNGSAGTSSASYRSRAGVEG